MDQGERCESPSRLCSQSRNWGSVGGGSVARGVRCGCVGDDVAIRLGEFVSFWKMDESRIEEGRGGAS